MSDFKKHLNEKLQDPNKPNSLNIEPIECDSEDYQEIQKIKAQNNTKTV